MTDYGDAAGKERAACRNAVGVADLSFLGKLELQGEPRVVADDRRQARRRRRARARAGALHDDVWWCPITAGAGARRDPTRGDRTSCGTQLEPAAAGDPFASVCELTAALGSNAVVGPLARETFARTTALDLRPERFAEAAFAPVSVARTPGMILRERGDRFLHLFGAGLRRIRVDRVRRRRARALGGRAVGAEALRVAPRGEVPTGA